MSEVSYLKSKDSTFLEASWERQMQFAGMERWEKSQYTKSGDKVDVSATDVGQKFLRRFHADTTKAIEEAQVNLIGGRSRGSVKGKAACVVVPAETCALLTLKVILDVLGKVDDHNLGYSYQRAVKRIAKAIETEMNFRHWLSESKEAAKEYARVNGLEKVPMSQAERIIKESGLNHTSQRRFRLMLNELAEYKWDELEYHYSGDFLLNTVLDALSEQFESHVAYIRGKLSKHIRMTPEFRKEFDKMGERIARFQVIKKPMLVRPQAWATC